MAWTGSIMGAVPASTTGAKQQQTDADDRKRNRTHFETD
jgi:hypothetical protein